MNIGELLSLSGVDVSPGVLTGDVSVISPTGVFLDSREVSAGGIFVAVPGLRTNGVLFADQAYSRGAALVVSEEDAPPGISKPWVRVADARGTLAALAANFHDNPSRSLLVVGVTGTNGKTTTTYLIESIFQQAGIETGRISSVSNSLAADQPDKPSTHTTPEAPTVQSWLSSMRDRSTQACVMEVSSHALAQRRVDYVQFKAGVFTNLSQEHLEFHGDMAHYFRAKARLFEMLSADSPAVVNIDDMHGQELAKSAGCPVTYGLDSSADITPDRLALERDGTHIEARTPRGMLHLTSPLVGRIAAYNIVAAAATAVSLDISFQGIEDGVRTFTGVSGRMQKVSNDRDDDLVVMIDFAHTNDALRGVLEAVRPLTRGHVVTVFGCGGDRDVAKRPLMGAVAADMSDRVVLTSDNPRSEQPLDIIADIELGLAKTTTPYVTVPDREEAIMRAIIEADAGDIVVIAGKGHEQYQEIGTQLLPFEDGSVARMALSRRHAATRMG